MFGYCRLRSLLTHLPHRPCLRCLIELRLGPITMICTLNQLFEKVDQTLITFVFNILNVEFARVNQFFVLAQNLSEFKNQLHLISFIQSY